MGPRNARCRGSTAAAAATLAAKVFLGSVGLGVLPAAGTTCSNGLAGVEDPLGKVCCAPSCPQCAGEGCGEFDGAHCCETNVTASNIYCDVTQEAPCILGSVPASLATLASSPNSPSVAPTSTPPSGAVTPTAAPKEHIPRGPPVPSISPTQAKGLDDGIAQTSIAAASVVGGFLLVVLVLTCAGLKSHCNEKRKSILRSLEALFARGSFWGAMFVLFGLLIALNIYDYSSPWPAVIIFGTFVIWFGVVAWFVAFQTGTPATVSLDCRCRACSAACRVEDGGSSDAGSSSSRSSSSSSNSSSSSRSSSRSSSACSTPSNVVSPKRPCSSRGRGRIMTPQAAAAAPSPAAVRPAADSFFPETVVRAVYFPSSTQTLFVPSTAEKATTASSTA
ncbi:unnamed protein product [Ectocarpus fasciculatus]